MSNVTIVGTQWGDEGKGKIVDWLSSKAEIVVRFQGGNNAGHTINIGKRIFKLSLLPSGIIRGKLSIIRNGVVLDPWELKKEIQSLKKKNIKIDKTNFMIAENVHIILPYHKKIDEINENYRGKQSIGTTRRGIGPAYEDKVGRRGIRLGDLFDKKKLLKKIEFLSKYHNIRLKAAGFKIIRSKNIFNELKNISNFILPYSTPVWKLLNKASLKNKKILFEGAQGSLLDIDFGTYPFVTSSNTLSGQVLLGSGFNKSSNNYSLGISKAYTTRVGNGPFPTELNDKTGEYLGNIGKEFGTVTNRKRRCGWFDAVLVKQTSILNGLNALAITKLDVLDGLDKIKICIGYKIKGIKIDYFPLREDQVNSIKPIYKTLMGWKSSTKGINKFDKLPSNAKKYIKIIEKYTGCKITIISTGPERNETILLEDPFNSSL